ncbi:beta-sandwich lipoprotein [Burkholderia sp. PU8-34]
MNMNRPRFLWSLAFCCVSALTACSNDADVASQNLSTAADNFQINRRIVFYNGFTGEYMLTIEGLCSKDNSSTDTKLAIICKTGPNSFKKHFLGLSNNVTYFIEQLDAADAGTYHYKVVFKPSTIVPDVSIK